ncbi:hypothetical protein ASE16_18850 [Leifsonia sp. Root227]|uniref:hypothetical protein n=1 Tax=Leifsonia sp. Root227 TaxID=1736496 RepID=UPI0006F912E5|nr:hypothetical protein [Leifsonia sp. Root227]KRC47357.1 hypothetical protein ASE16_18850 [Leifsonia sp. Root227]
MTAGRDRIAPRALERLARAVAAEALGVRIADTAARVVDSAGAIAVRIQSPVAMPPLRDGTGIGAGTGLTVRLADAAADTRARLAELTGLEVTRVDVRATGAVITERRVR